MEYIPAKTILSHNKSTAWFGIQETMNLYRGCCHGCIYCDSRSDCYHIENFDIVKGKENAIPLLEKELRRKRNHIVIGTGAMSDPYNPFEKQEQLTKQALELLDRYQFGCSVATKSDLITRDIAIFQQIQSHSPVLCKITITSGEDDLAKKVEPYAPLPSQRWNTIRQLSESGIFTGVLLMPVFALLEDKKENILTIVQCSKEAGARFIYPAFGMTMRSGQREWYLDQLEQQFPGHGLKARYQKRYGDRYQCTSPHAKELWHVFSETCQSYGILYRMQEIIAAYQRGYRNNQLCFF